jgi:type IV pilus biogenesis protein CpaD/CtpE
MKKMLRYRHGALVLASLVAAGAAEAKVRNFGVSSVNQPVVSATQAQVPNCPNWASGGVDSAALTDSNYGCASNTNLAAMVADPMDLIHGKSDGSTDIASSNRAIKAWREADPTSKLWVTTYKLDLKAAAGQ